MLVLGAIILFPLVLHALLLAGQVGAALVLMVVFYLAALLPWWARAPWRRAGAVLAGIALCAVFATANAGPLEKSALLYLPPVAINLWLMTVCGASLRRGAVPLITRIAHLEGGPLRPEVLAYTRRLTGIWALLFLAMGAESLLLALFAPVSIWSWFVNIWNYVFVALLFVGEHLYRRWRFPQDRHASPLALLQLMRSVGWRQILQHRIETS